MALWDTNRTSSYLTKRFVMKLVKCSLCLFTLLFQINSVAMPRPLDGIAATVNDSIITKSALKHEATMAEQQILQSGHSLPSPQVLERQVLERMILKEIQLQMAKRSGIHVSEAAIDHTLESIAKQNHLSLTQLREAVQLEGLDFQTYRQTIREQLEINQLQQRDILGQIQISEHEVDHFLESPNGLGGLLNEYRIGHILVALPDVPTPQELTQAEQKALQIVSQLREGKPFSSLAFSESNDGQALNGGDLGWRKLPELPTIFEKVVPALNNEEVADPIRSNSGFHVVKLLDKRTVNPEQPKVNKSLVRHILIKTNALTSDEEAKQRLVGLRTQILQGSDFAELAKAHSADLASASNGGSIGWVTKEVLVPEFSNKMESQALNEISEPFESPFGWHIVQVLDRKSESNDETALRQKAKEMIQQRKFEEKLAVWQRQIKDDAYIKLHYDS